jgi:hypothetical protein
MQPPDGPRKAAPWRRFPFPVSWFARAEKPKALITGCGRSGTAYISSLLSLAGLDVGHEVAVGKYGIASWLLAVPADSVPWGPARRDFPIQTILHQVRHPLAVISSSQTLAPHSWEFICKHIPCEVDEPLALRCAKYWHFWNQSVESEADWRYRVEDLPAIWDELCRRVRNRHRRRRLPMPPLPSDVNTRKGAFTALEWSTLRSLDARLCVTIQEQAVRYGYDA